MKVWITLSVKNTTLAEELTKSESIYIIGYGLKTSLVAHFKLVTDKTYNGAHMISTVRDSLF